MIVYTAIILCEIYLLNSFKSNKTQLFKLHTYIKTLISSLVKIDKPSQVKKLEHIARSKPRRQVTLEANKITARLGQARTALRNTSRLIATINNPDLNQHRLRHNILDIARQRRYAIKGIRSLGIVSIFNIYLNDSKIVATLPSRPTIRSKTPQAMRTATAPRPTRPTSWGGPPSYECSHFIPPIRVY